MRTGERTRWVPARRALLPLCLLAVMIGCTAGLAMSGRATRRDSTQVLLAANRLERLVADIETGQLGYVATGNDGALSPWQAARAAFPRQAAVLERLAAENGPEQARRAREIVRAATAYIREHAEPLMRTARRDRATARSVLARAEGKRRVEAIRRQFDLFADVQHRQALADERDAVPAMRRMIAAAAGVLGSLLLIFLLARFVMRGRGAGPVAGPMWPRPGRLRRIAREREAVQRVATLAAEDDSTAEVFDAAAREMGRVLGAEHAMICQYEPGGMTTVTGHWSAPGTPRIMPPLEGRWPVEDESVADMVFRTGRPARPRKDVPAVGEIGAWLRAHGVKQLIGCPIVAGDRLWGMAAILSRAARSWPADTEQTMLEFASLVGAGIVNARRRTELAASRVRLVEAADAARHRIERELHQKTQQRLVTVGLELRAAEATVPPGLEQLREQVSCAARDVLEIIEDLQDVARELHPAFLTKGGLEASVRALARRAALPVEVDVRAGRPLPPNVAVTIYYVVAEALRNAAAHAHASAVWAELDLNEPVRLSIHDDGIGGAVPHPGSALTCLRDRVEALGGVFEIDSPPGDGTTLRLTIPAGIRSPRHQ